jgi:UDP-glucose 4-epimerase
MKVLILGSCGFIGQALVHYYKTKGDIVFGIDVLERQEENYHQISGDEHFFSPILNTIQPEIIINAAGAANVSQSIIEPGFDYSSNVKLLFNLLNAIREAKLSCKIIHLSSAAVYGNPLKLPVTADEPIKPLSPYGFHKWQSEIICKEFASIYGLNIAIARIFSVYGCGLRKQIFWDLYQKISHSNCISLFGTGRESRDFIFIDDLVEALDCIVQKGIFDASIYNVANGEEIFIDNAVKYFLENIGWQGELKFSGDSRSGDPLNWKADIKQIKELGYRQKIDFKKGIELYSQWVKNNG